MKSRLRCSTNGSVVTVTTVRRPRLPARLGQRLEAAGRGEPVGLDAECHVGPGREVRERDDGGQLDQRGVADLLAQARDHLVVDGDRRLAHRLGVVHHVALERREDVRLAPARHLTRLVHVDVLVAGLEVVEVEAPACSRCSDATAMCANVFSPSSHVSHFWTFCPTRGHAHQHLLVVPVDADRRRHLAERLLDDPLQQRALEAGDLGCGDPGVAHVFLLGCGVCP